MNRFLVMALSAGLMAGCGAASPSGGRDLAPIRVATFNIRYGKAADGPNDWNHRREMVFQVFRDHRVDLAGLQEVLRFQLDEIRAALPEYGEIAVGRDDGRSGGEACAILYRLNRFEVMEQGTFWLSDTPEVAGSRNWGNNIPRICTWARLRDRHSNSVLRMFNTHLDHQSQPARERGAELVVQKLRAGDRDDTPVILTGDFNAGEDNPAVRYLKGEIKAVPAKSEGCAVPPPLLDTFRVLYPDVTPAGTFNGFKGHRDGAKIDYILASPGFKVLEAAIVRDNRDGRYPSDHFPVTATLNFKGSKQGRS